MDFVWSRHYLWFAATACRRHEFSRMLTRKSTSFNFCSKLHPASLVKYSMGFSKNSLTICPLISSAAITLLSLCDTLVKNFCISTSLSLSTAVFNLIITFAASFSKYPSSPILIVFIRRPSSWSTTNVLGLVLREIPWNGDVRGSAAVRLVDSVASEPARQTVLLFLILVCKWMFKEQEQGIGKTAIFGFLFCFAFALPFFEDGQNGF